MSTKNQRVSWKYRFKYHRPRRPAFKGNPHRKGVVMRLRIITPKKPNSARRPVTKTVLTNNKRITAHIPGSGHNLRRYSKVLTFGVGARDLPGVSYSNVRGKHDFAPLKSKTKRRSVYGVARPSWAEGYIRKKYRK